MTVHLSTTIEQILRALAARTGRDVNAVVEDAVRQYLAAGSVSDVAPEDVARVQVELLEELGRDDRWGSPPGEAGHAEG